MNEDKSKLDKAKGMLATWARAASDDENYKDMVDSTWELINKLGERKIMKKIAIKEDFRVPGTDVILEAGDRIEVSNKNRKQEEYGSQLRSTVDEYIREFDDFWDAGLEFSDDIMVILRGKLHGPSVSEFVNGMISTLSDYQ